MRGRALLFGLNYATSPDAKLNGCINDVINISKYLNTNLGIPVKVCTDDGDTYSTSAMGIIRNLYELALQSYSEKLDFVWVHYSGHGSYIVDKSGDEKDGKDECLVPSDYAKSGMISDDFINTLFGYFNPNTRVICVFDCCHSGTIGDVKYSWEGPKTCAVENILCSIPARIITLSGCFDNQTSADAHNVLGDNKYVGALTSCLLMVLKEQPQVKNDVFQMIANLRTKLRERGFSQLPKLCSTYNLARDKVFIPSQ
uniref:Peptidase C14 caspase domain-containing protein n=1 Tax=viral metagenome TaxID=1070528 RepID=A0A6C0BGG3_9ZZZZ